MVMNPRSRLATMLMAAAMSAALAAGCIVPDAHPPRAVNAAQVSSMLESVRIVKGWLLSAAYLRELRALHAA